MNVAKQRAIGEVPSIKKARLKKSEEERKAKELAELQELQAGQLAELTRGFRTSAELAAARQIEQLEGGVGAFTQRAGIGGSELAASLAARERGRLASQTLGATTDFGQRLRQAQAANETAFLQGKFRLFDAFAQAEFQAQLDRELAAFQAQIAQDQASWTQWLKTVDQITSVVALL